MIKIYIYQCIILDVIFSSRFLRSTSQCHFEIKHKFRFDETVTRGQWFFFSDEFIRNDALIIKIVVTKKPNTPWLSDLRFTCAPRTYTIRIRHSIFTPKSNHFSKQFSYIRRRFFFVVQMSFPLFPEISKNYNKLRKKFLVSLCSYSRHFGCFFTRNVATSTIDIPSVCIARHSLTLGRLCWNFIRCYCNLVDSTWIQRLANSYDYQSVGHMKCSNSILAFMLMHFCWWNREAEIKSHNLKCGPNHVMYVIHSKNRVFKEFAKSQDFVHSAVRHMWFYS